MSIFQNYSTKSDGTSTTAFMDIDAVDLGMSNEEIIDLVTQWKGISKPYSKVITEGEINHKYYTGEIVDDKFEVNTEFNVNDNRIYIGCKTIIPMVTSKPAEPVVYPGKPGNPKSEELANQHQKLLKAIYESKNLQKIVEKVVLHNLQYKIGVIFYGIRDGDIYTTEIHPKKLIIDMEATSIEDAQFIGIKNMDTAENIIARFPEKESVIKEKVNGKLGSKIEFIEWFTNEYVIVTLGYDVVLKKGKNPHFDFEGKEITDPETGEVYMERNPKKNYFKDPKKPFIILNVENDGTSIIDTTSPITQARSLQDNINRIKKNISINASKAGNPYLRGRGFDDDQLDELNNDLEAGDVIGLSGEQELDYLQAQSLPNFVAEDLRHSIAEVDNLFGTHGTSRGEREARESATGREILRQGDEDTQAPRGRAIERMLAELYNAWTQLIKIHFTEEELSYTIGNTQAKEYIKASAKGIEDGIEIRVLPGSIIPEDKITKMNRALQLAQLGLFPREYLFKELGYENYKEIAEALDVQDAIAQQRQQEIAQKEQERQQNAEVGNQSFAQVQQMIESMQ